MTLIHPPPRGLEWLEGEAPHKELARLRKSGTLRKLLPEVDALYGIPQERRAPPRNRHRHPHRTDSGSRGAALS